MKYRCFGIVVVLLVLAASCAKAAEEILSITLTDISEISWGFSSDGITPNQCIIHATVNNDTGNRVNNVVAYISVDSKT
jgi:hypothetical protein